MKKRVASIYMIICLITKKVYIGKTTKSVRIRYQEHLRDDPKTNRKLGKAIKEFGKENFGYLTLENVYDEKKVKEKEDYYIEKYNAIENGYNMIKGGQGCRVRLTDLEVINICKTYRETQNLSQTSKKCNVSIYIAKKNLQKQGIQIKTKVTTKIQRKPRKQLSDIQTLDILKTYKELGNLKYTAEKCDVSEYIVNETLKKFNVKKKTIKSQKPRMSDELKAQRKEFRNEIKKLLKDGKVEEAQNKVFFERIFGGELLDHGYLRGKAFKALGGLCGYRP